MTLQKLVSGLAVALALVSAAATAPAGEIPVTLFGTACALRGPFDEGTLKTIHSLSPEQISPAGALVDLLEPLKKSLEKVRKEKSLPPAFDLYKEHLGRRFEAQIAFLKAAGDLKKKPQLEVFAKAIGPYLRPSQKAAFDAIFKRQFSGKTASGAAQTALNPVFEAYNDAIEPDPEEEFHRAIQKLGVQYHCSYDEAGGE